MNITYEGTRYEIATITPSVHGRGWMRVDTRCGAVLVFMDHELDALVPGWR